MGDSEMGRKMREAVEHSPVFWPRSVSADQFIPILNRNCVNYPRPSRDRFGYLGMVLQVLQAVE